MIFLMYPLGLCPGRVQKQCCAVALNTPSAWSFISKYHFPLKESSAPWRNTDSNCETGNVIECKTLNKRFLEFILKVKME